MTAAFTRKGRGLGCIELERPPVMSFGSARSMVSVGAVSVPRVSLADRIFIPSDQQFPDQANRQECVGWMIAQLVHTTMSAHGSAPLQLSPGGIYLGARARRYGWDAVWDGGCNPHEAFEHVREVGAIPYAKWPAGSPVNANPDPDCYRLASDHDWIRPRWVLDTFRTPIVKSLLVGGFAVGCALRIDDGLEEWRSGDEPWERIGPMIGGHAVTIVGFDTYGPHNDETVWVVANSWGPDFGDEGFFLMDSNALESNQTTYVCALEVDEQRLA
jgi:hypothetical protein